VFRLPSESRSRDPIRRRAKAKFPWGTFFLCFASLFVIGVLGYGAYEMFVRQSDPPLETFTNTQGIKMVLLEGGKFRMGAPDAELGPQHRPEESPQHEVTVRGPFFMAATEVSHSQYLKVMGVSPTKSADRAHKAQNLPVENVTWDQANDFCRKLTESEKDQKWARRGWGYRLPSEAEWEYAARAGTDTLFAFGDRIQFEKQALFQPRDKDPQKDPLAAGVPANAKRLEFPQEVGKTEPNRFGLYDMHGNVSEWCLDWYRAGYPSDSPQDNPTGPSSGDKRVIRGGSYKDPSTAVRSAWRAGMRPGEASDSVGFRVVYAPVMK
jgi:formylglycine-generating enzyme required for sulfatase activity